jgi:hypothetical protein
MKLTIMRSMALAALPVFAAAHSNVIIPRPRNAVDALTDKRFGSCSLGKGCSPLENGQGHCAYGQSCGCQCVNGTSPCDIGQTCMWFSQGCTIVSPPRHASPHQFDGGGGGGGRTLRYAALGPYTSRASAAYLQGCPTCTGVKARAQVDTCGAAKRGVKALICDPRLRTYNIKAPCNTKADIYRWNPWRYMRCCA